MNHKFTRKAIILVIAGGVIVQQAGVAAWLGPFARVVRLRRVAGLLVALGVFGLGAPGARAFVYWTNAGGNTIGRANLDGTGVNQRFIMGAPQLLGVAVDAHNIYWTNNGVIARASLDGSGVDQSFITAAVDPRAVAVDGSSIYWADAGGMRIGRANLGGSGVDPSFITGGNGPRGVAVDATHVYWTNAGSGAIGRANLDGSGVDQTFIAGASAPNGVAVDGNHIYWANSSNGTIGWANLDGSGVDQSFIAGASSPNGVAVDGNRLYWTNRGTGTIGRANLDGTGVDQSFITGARFPTGLAVDASTLSVVLAGPGAGNVTSTPAGINCGHGGLACGATFAVGSRVQLAVGQSSGSGFEGFTGGGCTGPFFLGPFFCNLTIGASSVSVTATFGLPPSVSITTPPDGASYTFGSVPNSSFSCAAGAGATLQAGSAGCNVLTDGGGVGASGTPLPGELGSHFIEVTAWDTDGEHGGTTHFYTVHAGAPAVSVTTPADDATYAFASVPSALFTCTAGAGGALTAGLAGCGASIDGAPAVASGTPLAGSVGSHTIVTTATDTDAQMVSVIRSYTVQPPPPSVSIRTPTDGASFAFGSAPNSSFSCTAGVGGTLNAGLAGCSASIDGGAAVESGTALAGSVGSHTIVVTATQTNTQTVSATHTYSVIAAPTLISAPSSFTGDLGDPVTVSGTLKDQVGNTLSGKTLTFTLNGSESCTATTVGSGVGACSITPGETAGSDTLVIAFAGDAEHLLSSANVPFTVTEEQTATAYTGPTVIPQGGSGVTLTGRLVEDANPTRPIAGRTLTLSLGSQSCDGTTSPSGDAACTLPASGVLGWEQVGASFAGDGYYQPSSDASKMAIVFAFPSNGGFVLGDHTVAAASPTSIVTWWSHRWSGVNGLSAGAAPNAFKGFAASVTNLPTTTAGHSCSGTWKTGPGNSSSPPSVVPTYMGALVATKVTQEGSRISGDYTQIVVVQTNPGYASDGGHPGTGTIVATYCP